MMWVILLLVLGFDYLMTEYSLHSEVKAWYSVLGDELEVKVSDGLVVNYLDETTILEEQRDSRVN